eukprot:TRINITY_DN2438_c0_g1_i1.p1 TRINITY_DN2438_c0_g1~~TRINITY_DN2438_c0_g1_i1.p1  ORF type:complete len:591 (+),score=103.53 TRINITY_DN2438_c0_g1_i1:104-1876(+)
MAENCVSPSCMQSGKVKKTAYTYWVQGVPSSDLWNMFTDEGWHKIDLEEGKAPFFSRFRRTCRSSLVKLAHIRPFPYATCLAHCCDKKQFYSSMTAAGYSRSVPETYFSYESLRKMETKDRPNTGEVWYVKTSDGCHGRGVQVFDDFRELKSHVRSLHNEPYVIQRGVSQLHLVGGKKWTVRTHVLITPDLQLYSHNNGVIIIHSEEYKEGSLERAAQILHNSKATRYSLLDGPVKHLLPHIMPQINKISFQICNSIRTKLYKAVNGPSQHSQSPCYYALMGLDFIVDSSKTVHCLEVNEFPQFDFSSEPAAHEVVVDTFKDFLSLVVFPRATPLCGVEPKQGGWVLLPPLDFSQDDAPQDSMLEKSMSKKRRSSALPHSTDAEKKMFHVKEMSKTMELKEKAVKEKERTMATPPVSPLKMASPPTSPLQRKMSRREVSSTVTTVTETVTVEESSTVPYENLKEKHAEVGLPAALRSVEDKPKRSLPPPIPPPMYIPKKTSNRQTLKLHRVGVRSSGQNHNHNVNKPHYHNYSNTQNNLWPAPTYSHEPTAGKIRNMLYSLDAMSSCKVKKPIKNWIRHDIQPRESPSCK